MKEDSTKSEPTHAQKFDSLLGKLLSVPKEEIQKREAEYKKERATKRQKSGQ